jgi:hypothetical protein
MFRRLFSRPREGRRRGWPRSRAVGFRLWIVLPIVILIVLFRAVQRVSAGTKADGLGGLRGTLCTFWTTAPMVPS